MQYKASHSLAQIDVQAAVHFLDVPIGGVMCLRFSVTLITGTVLAVSTLAHAKTPVKATPAPVPFKIPATPALSPTALAQVEAIISYCERVDPLWSAKYQQLGNLVLSGQSSSQMADDAKGSAYQSELGVMGAALAKVPVSTGVSSCKAGIAGM